MERRKRQIYWAVGTFLIVLLYSITAVVFLKNGSEEKKRHSVKEEKKITFISPLRWDLCAKGIEDAMKSSDIDIKHIMFSKLDGSKQIDAIRSAIYAGVDGIITAGMEEDDEFVQVIDEAWEKDIPLVLIDTDIPKSRRICYVGTDNYSAGMQAGNDMIDAAGEKELRVAVVVSNLVSSNQKERVRGFEDILTNIDNISVETILEGQSNDILIRTMVTDLLKKDDQINAFYLAEGHASSVVGEVLEELDLDREFTIVSFGISDYAIEKVRDGSYFSNFYQQFYEMGYQAAECLLLYYEGEKLPGDIVYTEVQDIRKEQAGEMSGVTKKEEEIVWQTYY